jgi:hypothetical protein
MLTKSEITEELYCKIIIKPVRKLREMVRMEKPMERRINRIVLVENVHRILRGNRVFYYYR